LADSLKKKEKSEMKLRTELERRIDSEKEAKEKVEGLERALSITKEPTIYDVVQKYYDAEDPQDDRNYGSPKDTAPLLDLYERIMSLSDEQLKYQIKFTDSKYHRTVLHIAAFNQFPHATLSRLIECGGCDINATNKSGSTALVYAAQLADKAIFDNLALLGADLSVKYTNYYGSGQVSSLSSYKIQLSIASY
jgi:hypothetical protein